MNPNDRERWRSTIKLTEEQTLFIKLESLHSNVSDISITLTDEQMRAVAMTLQMDASERNAHKEFDPVLEALGREYEPELFHSGGGVWLVEIGLDDLKWESGTDPEGKPYVVRPYIWISPSEKISGQQTWDVGAYDGENGEGIYSDAEQQSWSWVTNVPTQGLRHTVGPMLEELRDWFSQAHTVSTESAQIWLAHHIGDNEIKAPSFPLGWEVTRMVEVPQGISYVEYGGNRHESWYYPTIWMLSRDDASDQTFCLYWHDGVTGEWTEWFESYDQALNRFAKLFIAVSHDTHLDMVEMEVSLRSEPVEDALIHFQTKHPELVGEDREVREWYGIPYRADGVLSGDDKTLLMYYDTAKSGDGEIGRSEWYCNHCEAELDISNLDKDG